MEPEGGQVSEYGTESSKKPSCSGTFIQSLSSGFQSTVSFRREEPFDIFDDHQSGLEDVDGSGHVGPQAGAGVGREAGAFPGGGDVGAGEAAGQDADRPVLLQDAQPADLGDVAEVRDGRPVAGEDAGGVLVLVLAALLVRRLVLGMPDDLAAEHRLHRQVEGAGAGEQ